MTPHPGGAPDAEGGGVVVVGTCETSLGAAALTLRITHLQSGHPWLPDSPDGHVGGLVRQDVGHSAGLPPLHQWTTCRTPPPAPPAGAGEPLQTRTALAPMRYTQSWHPPPCGPTSSRPGLRVPALPHAAPSPRGLRGHTLWVASAPTSWAVGGRTPQTLGPHTVPAGTRGHSTGHSVGAGLGPAAAVAGPAGRHLKAIPSHRSGTATSHRGLLPTPGVSFDFKSSLNISVGYVYTS